MGSRSSAAGRRGAGSFINGVETDRLPARDFTAYESAASDNDWRLSRGYGAFIASLATDLSTSFDSQVTAIREDDGVILETSRGTIRAAAAIVL